MVSEATEEARKGVHSHLLDNLNTGGAIEELLKLVSVTNKYMKQREAEKAASATGDSISLPLDIKFSGEGSPCSA